MSVKLDRLVLLTSYGTYFVEYKINKLILSDSISQAMIFEDQTIAEKFQKMLLQICGVNSSINTYIGNL